MTTLEERFAEKFGKDGTEESPNSIGRSAGCDDCFTNRQLRQEHLDFLHQEVERGRREERTKLRKAVDHFKVTIDGANLKEQKEVVLWVWNELIKPKFIDLLQAPEDNKQEK